MKNIMYLIEDTLFDVGPNIENFGQQYIIYKWAELIGGTLLVGLALYGGYKFLIKMIDILKEE